MKRLSTLVLAICALALILVAFSPRAEAGWRRGWGYAGPRAGVYVNPGWGYYGYGYGYRPYYGGGYYPYAYYPYWRGYYGRRGWGY